MRTLCIRNWLNNCGLGLKQGANLTEVWQKSNRGSGKFDIVKKYAVVCFVFRILFTIIAKKRESSGLSFIFYSLLVVIVQ